jgi:hypothetical protein
VFSDKYYPVLFLLDRKQKLEVKNEGKDQEYIELSYAASRGNIINGFKKIKDTIEERK